MAFPFYKQFDSMDCGPACLRMVAKHYGKTHSMESLRQNSNIDREGVSLMGISEAAERIHLKSLAVTVDFEKLKKEAPLPCIAHWNQNHFIVVYKIKGDQVYIADPAKGLINLSIDDFKKGWISNKVDDLDEGICLLLEPTAEFNSSDDEKIDKKSWSFLLKYLHNYKGLLIQLFIGLTVGSLLQLLFPFLTQSVVDYGINNQNLNFVYLILIAQLVLFFSQTVVDAIRSWILLHISSRVNISLISDFLSKLMKLPISFFDTKIVGDLMQRINDHYRIEKFLTASTIGILFSFFNLIIFGIVLIIYDVNIFLIFSIGSILYVSWVIYFMKKRKNLDYKKFDVSSANQSKIIQLIQGMQEIKLNNSETLKRWEWEKIQAKVFKLNVETLQLSQIQELGGVFINQLKNILISFYTAKLVIEGNLTLGMMMSVQYIIGQLSSPINQLLGFAQLMQDAKISLERLGEIHNKENEENAEDHLLTELPNNKDLNLTNVSFQYGGPQSEFVLKNINAKIKSGKITAIVGTSGSGKTTLIKLLMKFYDVKQGEIKLGESNLKLISSKTWRSNFGAVMQDGFIFSDSIANNIAIGSEKIDKEKLLKAVKTANIQQYIDSLPLGYNTKIGADGNGLSQGQKQRILIARAVYKNPEFIFFDEATNALDANNERAIMKNMDDFFKDKTVVIVAHRLSTVKNADHIIVLDRGEMVEEGTHQELVNNKGAIFHIGEKSIRIRKLMYEHEKIELRSEEVNEILSQVPNWIVRWGSTAILMVVISVIMVCWFVKYPDLIKGNVELITQNPPIVLPSKLNSKITKLNFQNNSIVLKNDVIAVLETNANMEDIDSFNSFFSKLNIHSIDTQKFEVKRNLNLGEIQTEYIHFINALDDYHLFKSNSIEYKSIAHIQQQINNVQQINQTVSAQEFSRNKQLELQFQKLKNDQRLFEKGIISKRELDITESQYLEMKSNIENYALNNQANTSKIQEYQKQINDYEIAFIDKKSQKISLLLNAYNALFQKYEDWKNNFLITAPYDGKISYLNNWTTNQFINAGTELFSIVPNGNKDNIISGSMLIPILGIGKVAIKQKVNIRLHNYPDKEFGLLLGEVTNISPVANKDKLYMIQVKLTNGLTTTYQKKLDFAQQMNGTGEIITEEKRILERVFENVLDLIKN